MNESGSSQNTSTLAEGIPRFAGVSQPLLAGSPRKKGAPSISRPATDPKLQSTFAPSARVYHSTAAGPSETASITEMTVAVAGDFITVSIPATAPAGTHLPSTALRPGRASPPPRPNAA